MRHGPSRETASRSGGVDAHVPAGQWATGVRRHATRAHPAAGVRSETPPAARAAAPSDWQWASGNGSRHSL
ncbi:MAG TPA: hypothetical protein EYP56_16445 [Planctomycetaceae bacterium]|nr:hypothetical protein [Planctomycetaceae bacterium]